MASVQSFVLLHTLFSNQGDGVKNWQTPTSNEQREVLIVALTHMIWQAAGDAAVVVIPAEGVVMERSQRFKGDGVTERLRLFTLRDQQVGSSFTSFDIVISIK